jgi:MFS family permease
VRAWWSLIVLIIAYAVSFIDRQILSLLVEPLKTDLAISDTQVGLLQGLAFAVFYCALAIPVARLAERHGRIRIILVGVTIWSAMTIGCGLARSFGMLFVSRLGVGLGEAALSPSAQSLVTDYFPRERLGLAQSLYGVAIPVGGGLAIMLGGLIAQSVGTAGTIDMPMIGAVRGWQAAFLIVGGASLLLVPLLATLKEPPRRNFGKAEVSGETLGAFFHRRRTLFTCYFGALAVLTLMAYANVAWFPSYFIRVHGLSRSAVGLYYGVVLAVAGTAGLVAGGFASDWLVRRGVVTGHLIVALGATLFAIIPGTLTPLAGSANQSFMLMVPLIFFGAMPTGAAATMTQLITPPHLRGMVVAVFLLVINVVGIGLGPLSIGLLNDKMFGDPAAIGQSMALVIGLSTTIGALLLALAVRPYARALKELDAARA